MYFNLYVMIAAPLLIFLTYVYEKLELKEDKLFALFTFFVIFIAIVGSLLYTK